MTQSSVESMIAEKLRAAFRPAALEIINESGHHRGHSRHQGGVAEETGETHFRVKITAAAFSGMGAKERHRAVYHVLAHELKGPVHALALEIKAPNE